MTHISQDILRVLLRSDLNLESVKEYTFASPRRWRFDIAIPSHMIAIELEGGAFTGGRHTRGTGFIKDIEKYNEATVLGWRLLRYAHVATDYKRILSDVRRLVNGN